MARLKILTSAFSADAVISWPWAFLSWSSVSPAFLSGLEYERSAFGSRHHTIPIISLSRAGLEASGPSVQSPVPQPLDTTIAPPDQHPVDWFQRVGKAKRGHQIAFRQLRIGRKMVGQVWQTPGDAAEKAHPATICPHTTPLRLCGYSSPPTAMGK